MLMRPHGETLPGAGEEILWKRGDRFRRREVRQAGFEIAKASAYKLLGLFQV